MLQEAGSPIEVVLFPTSCVLSLQTLTEDGAMVEVAMIGREGVIGFPGGYDAPESPYAVAVQFAGQALRLRPDVLRGEFDHSPAVRHVMVGYWQALLAEVARGSACHCFHTAQQRLSRWLLTASDRTQSRAVDMTHEEFASILGLPRTRITASALALKDGGAIRYRHGHVTILDRSQLERTACECYRAGRAAL
jgi:CRP-like cAMP-binding protein